jgi:2-haloacid dehalogenase
MAFHEGVRALTMDLYGTLVDTDGSLLGPATDFLRRKGFGGSPAVFLERWRGKMFQNTMMDTLLQKGHTPFRELLRRALVFRLQEAGLSFTAQEVASLVGEWERLRPYPDVREGLLALKGRYLLVVLSNGDRDMLEKVVPGLGVPMDRVISVAEAGVYKPHPAVYRTAAQLLKVEPRAILHVASHPFDLIGAKAAGMRTAYVDRHKTPFDETVYTPDLVVGDFRELAARLLAER